MSLFVDSGAHSLFNQVFAGTTTKGQYAREKADYNYADTQEFKDYLESYVEFIHANKDDIDVYVNVDIIFNPEKSWEVQQYLESCGLSPLPVFHFGEDIKWLKKYIDNYEYIGIGGLGQDISKKKFIYAMGDPAFSCICDTKNRLPKVKVHGFAVTAVDLLRRYPWYSVDSTTWLQFSAYGIVTIPKVKNGKFSYDENPWPLFVSNISPAKKKIDSHIDTISELERKVVFRYFEEKGIVLGKSKFREDDGYELNSNERLTKIDGKQYIEEVVEPGVCNDSYKRYEANLEFFLDLEASLPEWPWPFCLKYKGLGAR